MTVENPPARIATQADEHALYEMLVRLHRHNENGWGFPYSPVLVMRQIEVATRRDPKTRSDPRDNRVGVIGVIDGAQPGKFLGTVGIFMQSPMWFSEVLVPTELWLYVEPAYRKGGKHEADLMAFARWVRDTMRDDPAMADYGAPFPLMTGFMHMGPRYAAMQRLWQRLCKGRQVGSLFMVE